MFSKYKLIFIVFFAILFFFSYPFAILANAEPQTGVGSVLNTGGFINFDDYNGNIAINSETGNLSGFVWSNDLGWIDFSNNGSNGVKVNISDGKLSGKASVVNTPGFLDFTANGSDVKIDMANGSLSGYAWSEDIGWIRFSGVSSRIAGAISEINSLQALTQVGLNLLQNILFALALISTVSLLVVYARERKLMIR